MIEILEKWAKFSKYDPEQKSFSFGNNSFFIKEGNDLISKIYNTYDKTGGLAVIYAKHLCIMLLKDRKASFYDILSSPHDYDAAKEMWEIFNSAEVLALEQQYIARINSMVERAMKGRLIGNSASVGHGTEAFFAAVEIAINGLEKTHMDTYAKGGIVKPITKISTHIHVFETLGDCIIALEQAEDGMYLCYIKMYDTADGYFGFFVKNNGNLFSVNERIDEAYVGQHKRRRSASYAERKLYNLFPYDYMFTFSEHDYKGFATKHVIDADDLSIFNLGAEAYYPIVIAASLLKSEYEGAKIDAPLTYIKSLLCVNLLSDGDSGEKLAVLGNSLIVRQHDDMTIGFTVEGIKAGDYAAEFNKSDNVVGESGIFSNRNQLFVELYGDGFDYDISNALKTDTHLLLPGRDMDKGTHPNSEFVGTEKRMRFQAYYAARKALAEHIELKMTDELESFHNSFGSVQKWFISSLKNNIGSLNKIIHDFAINAQSDNKQFAYSGHSDNINFSDTKHRPSNEPLFSIMRIDNICPAGDSVSADAILNDIKRGERLKYVCNITGNLCNVFFVVKPDNYNTLKMMTGLTELPKIVQGWQRNRYFGNPILNAIDPVDQLRTPFENSYHQPGKKFTYFDFAFAIGFSKRGLKKLMAGFEQTSKDPRHQSE